jgi:hypothetical protein
MITAIDQVTGVFADRDAVGGHTLALRDALRARGFDSEIFAEEVSNGVANLARPLTELERRTDDGQTMLVYHASSYTRAADVLTRRTEPLVVNYHNITPAKFFERWEPVVAESLVAAVSYKQIRAPEK